MRWFFWRKAFPHSGHTWERSVQLPSGCRFIWSINPCFATKLLPHDWQKWVFAFCCGGEVIWTTVVCGTCCWFCAWGCCWVTWTACCWITCCLIWGAAFVTCCWAGWAWIWICWCCWAWVGLWSIWLTTSPLDVIIWTGTGDDEDVPGCAVTNVAPVGKLTALKRKVILRKRILICKSINFTHFDWHLGRDDWEWRRLERRGRWWDFYHPNEDEDEAQVLLDY